MTIEISRAAPAAADTGKTHVTDNFGKILLTPLHKKPLLNSQGGELPADKGIRHFSVLSPAHP
jgi:hypothetical protein